LTQKDDSVYVEHILESINRIAEYVEDDRNKFYQSSLVQDAVIRNLQVLAESSQRLSDEFKSRHTDIPWREFSGFRNILVHGDLGIDLDAVWSVVEQDLPQLHASLTSSRSQ